MLFLFFDSTISTGIPPKPVVEMTPGHLIKLTVNNFKLLMKCTFYADGFEYKWEKKNARSIPRAEDINSRQLTIVNLRPEDSGEYRCILSNSTGVIMSDYSLLTVKGLFVTSYLVIVKLWNCEMFI